MKQTSILFILALLLVACGSDAIIAPSPGSIKGIVKGPITQRPLANVQMSTVPGTSVLLTDDNGAYEFTNVAAGDYIVQATYRDTAIAGYASMQVKVMSGATTKADLILNLGSPENGIISGKVNDESGKAVQGARITITPGSASAVTGADGSFLLIDIPPGTIVVRVVAGTLYGTASVVVERAVTARVNITAYAQDPSKGSVTGAITADNKPCSNAIVGIASLGIADTTDANGSYLLKNVPAGSYELTIEAQGFPLKRVTVSTTAGSPTVKNIDISTSSVNISTQNLELYLTLNESIADLSPKNHSMKELGTGNRFVADRNGVAGRAMEFNGTNGISTVDGASMNFKPVTLGAWVYIPSNTNTTQLILGKTLHPLGDGYYIAMENGVISFLYTTGGWAKYSRTDFSSYPKDQWIWIGYSVSADGSGWATVNGTTIKLVTPNASNNDATATKEQFCVGTLSTTSTLPGFKGAMDHVVLYSRYMTAEELKGIMDAAE
jgi:hypothetical protein